jgi:glycosyltransferase involved in cell wall biosynthesis
VPPFQELHVAIASLSLGGAERIVLDWAARIYPRWRVHLIVLRDRAAEWPVPSHVRVTRLGGEQLSRKLVHIGAEVARSANPVCVCHLLSTRERTALSQGGAVVVPVFHNARNGWVEDANRIMDAPYVIAVSQSCADELRADGWTGTTSVIRHIPQLPKQIPNVRTDIRRAWNIPEGALAIGMLGAVKPQKNYVFALRIFQALLRRHDAYLVIVGGPVNTGVGRETWDQVVAAVHGLGLRHRVAMPGFVPDASRYLSAFDIILNSSHFEGLSVATLEAILAGLPVVASRVGGQGEIMHDSLKLLPADAEPDVWADALLQASREEATTPAWADFPSYRLWTFAGIARPVVPSSKTLFVTANLSAGGAQRSLVNLTKGLLGKMDFEVIVAGKSSVAHFYEELSDAGVPVSSAGTHWNAFDYAEAIAAKVVSEGFGTVCFWNADARIKLLLAKAFAFGGPRFVDVSPGGHSFEEMEESAAFQQLAAFSEAQYLDRLDRLVLKYEGEPVAGCEGKTVVIRNGVPVSGHYKRDYAVRHVPRIVVSGRIAPTKFLIEIVDAMRILWSRYPDAELHVIGAAEPYHKGYYDQLVACVGEEKSRRVVFHGQRFDVAELLPSYDASVVLGKHQGCPNALLEAMMAGLPVVGNDDGGTREQIINGVTGLLVGSVSPILVADALGRLLDDRAFAQRLGMAARAHVLEQFSMDRMVASYVDLLADVAACPVQEEPEYAEQYRG